MKLDTLKLTEIWTQRAQALAQPLPTEPEGETLDLLSFSLNGSHYAIEVTYVREITYLRQITPVPRTPNFIVGVFNHHGRILSVTDLHAWWGLPFAPPTQSSQVIVVATNNDYQGSFMELGLLVDEVKRIFTVFQDDLVPSLTNQQDSFARFIRGIVLKTTTVLDLKTLLSDEQLVIQEAN